MIFNSFQFLCLFLPITLLGFYYLGRTSQKGAAIWLLLASFFFYCSWDYRFLPILLLSMGGNYYACRQILAAQPSRKKSWLIAAVVFNLVLLGYFKYVNFFIASINGFVSQDIQLLTIILPIGISFFTFTQISILVDAYYDKVQDINFLHYALFTSYFPYIVAGPVLHHKDMMPQFADKGNYQVHGNNFAVGLTLFAFGLAKKLLIADNLVPLVDAAFGSNNPQLFQAWLGVFAYSFQLYFDFSGYSDMAIGVSRLFGFQIPFNFNSPYKAASVSDFWLRWHISLSRFLRNYLYIPLGGNRSGPLSRYRNLLLTMLLGGLWHGSNWTFVIWGGLHGLYLCIQHGWRSLRGSRVEPPGTIMTFVNRALTFVAVMIAWCFFRAADVTSALNMLAAMAGGNGISVATAADPLAYAILALSAFAAFFLPNTNEIIMHLESRFENKPSSFSLFTVQWSPGIRWGVATGIILALCILSMDKPQDFIYAQF
ncbi:MBOAT family O-acyltransferase [uncultured Desulfobulbus sp.]|uniref:MBOAT family O-acyltransferase n=1 Tax=uncultured Desulfobulbus sp. TaxID=239745 RepID=UPI0029C88058|nr:MBOAT family O-acyltransferase [uncultured Desulfobulbus sp.]